MIAFPYRLARIVGMAVITALLISSCGGSPAPANTNATNDRLTSMTTLKLGLIGKLSGYWTMWIALQEGYFKAENIDIQATYIGTDAQLTDAVLSGSVDMDAESVYVDYQADKNGGDMTMFCGSQNTPFYRMLGKKGFTSLADLNGKKIGVSDSQSGIDSFVTQEWLGLKGIQPSTYTLTNTGALASRVAALSSGAIEATPLVPPFDLQTKNAGYADLGVSTDTVKHFMMTAWSARKSWLKKNEALAVSYCRAIAKGAAFLQSPANKDAAIKDLVDATQTATATATATYDSLVPVLTKDGSIDLAGFAPWAKYLNVKASDITNKLVDDTYFKKAKATAR